MNKAAPTPSKPCQTLFAESSVEEALEICREQCLPPCVELADLLEERDLMEQQVQEYRKACGSTSTRYSGGSKGDCLRAASKYFQGSIVESLCSKATSGTAECIREAARHFSTADTISQLCSGARRGTAECIREAAEHFSTVDPISRICAGATWDMAACVREALKRYSTTDGVAKMCGNSGS